MAVDYTDALEQDWRIFPIHPIRFTAEGVICTCDNENCEAAGKHPKSRNWQHALPLTDAQLDYLEDFDGLFFGNQLLNHYGIVIGTSGLLIVDIDGRNGGFESAKTLSQIREKCGFIVRTGSHNGEHWYFKNTGDAELLTKVAEYPGIDFKSSGYVVGCGSLHASGNRYEALSGNPKNITEAPSELLELLKRPVRPSFSVEGQNLELGELERVVSFIKHDSEQSYERWLAVGMALHHATDGAAEGEALWERWTLDNGRDDIDSISVKWHSFGKSAAPITQGSLLTWAREGGYTRPVTFVDDTDWGEPIEKPNKNNLLNPPGLVGELVDWINSRSMFPRKNLAVAAALQIVSNAAGLNFLVDEYDTSLNLITIGVAGSRTGKGSIKRCIDDIHAELGLMPATHGKFKSTQELIRNAIQHQAVYYIYDEFGKTLSKLSNSGRGGAHYLEDLVAEFIAMYSVATGTHGISGDLKREMRELLERQLANAAKKEDLAEGENIFEFSENNPNSPVAAAVKAIQAAEQGIINPFLSFFGLSEPKSYNDAIEGDPWLASGGFLGRALFFEELNNVPMARPVNEIYKGMPPTWVVEQLRGLTTGGNVGSGIGRRIERVGDWRRIKWSEGARALVANIQNYWREIAIREDESGTGMESQALGATELTIKVAGVLSVANELITETELQWAHELVQKITLDKIARTKAGEKLAGTADERGEGLLEGLLRHVGSLSSTEYTTAGKARQAVGRNKVTLQDVQNGLNYLTDKNLITKQEVKGANGRISVRYLKK